MPARRCGRAPLRYALLWRKCHRRLFVYLPGVGREETDLEEAIRHVVETRKIVTQQRQLIAHLKKSGVPTESAEKILHTLENNLAIFERHEKELRARAGK